MKRSFSIHADIRTSSVVLVLGAEPIGETKAKFKDVKKAMHTIGKSIRDGKNLNRSNWKLFSSALLDLNQAEFTRLRKLFGLV